MEPVFTVFDPDQRSVIDAPESARLIVEAGPGTGKTAVACARVARLINSGLAASRVLMLSFTRTAVAELRARIITQVSNKAEGRSLRLSTLDSEAWHLRYGFPQGEVEDLFGGFEASVAAVVDLLKKGPDQILDFMERLGHVIVDEAQDLNGVRTELILAMIGRLSESCGVTIFADPAQAIYGFTAEDTPAADARGAGFVESLDKRFPNAFGNVKLRQLYRTSDPTLRQIFQNAREVVLSNSIGGSARVAAVAQSIESQKPRPFSDIEDVVRWADPDASRDILVLFRRRSEALMLSAELSREGTCHRLRLSGYPRPVEPWLAITLAGLSEDQLRRTEFEARWTKHQHLPAFRARAAEDCWRQLCALAGAGQEALSMKVLCGRLTGTRAPPDVCTPELGTDGPIIGTVHASKGREAPRVGLLFRAVAGEGPDADEEARVHYVGATRARECLYVGSPRFTQSQTLEGSGRVYASPSGGDEILVEVGRDGDLDPLSLTAGNGLTDLQVAEAQELLTNLPDEPREVVAIRQRGDHRYWLRDLESGVHLGALASTVNADLFAIKSALPGSSKRPLPTELVQLYLIGARTVVTHGQSTRSRSSFLAPIVKGLCPVFLSTARRGGRQ
ncbi:MAG: UvrD-helicase domain-containing protein [Myxococcota bacterium]